MTNIRVLIVVVTPAHLYGWRALMNELASEKGDAAAADMRVRFCDMHGSHLYTPPNWRADAAAYLAANPIDEKAAKVRAKVRPTHRVKKYNGDPLATVQQTWDSVHPMPIARRNIRVATVVDTMTPNLRDIVRKSARTHARTRCYWRFPRFLPAAHPGALWMWRRSVW